MPLLHISLRAGKTEAYRQAIFDSLYRAMRDALNVPEDDQFMTINEHDAENFRYGNAYGVARSADVVYLCSTPAPWKRKKHYSGGLRSFSSRTLASAQKMCS
jgi:hypothetical protein